jgi:hypothetical protein
MTRAGSSELRHLTSKERFLPLGILLPQLGGIQGVPGTVFGRIVSALILLIGPACLRNTGPPEAAGRLCLAAGRHEYALG